MIVPEVSSLCSSARTTRVATSSATPPQVAFMTITDNKSAPNYRLYAPASDPADALDHTSIQRSGGTPNGVNGLSLAQQAALAHDAGEL
jgi:hypothetical protein